LKSCGVIKKGRGTKTKRKELIVIACHSTHIIQRLESDDAGQTTSGDPACATDITIHTNTAKQTKIG
jgi:hypothetical protein